MDPYVRPVQPLATAQIEPSVLSSGWWGGLLADLSDADKATALDQLRAIITAHETPSGVTFGSASWLIRARRPW